MNIASNPWNFVTGDVNVATPAASPTGLVLNADGTVTLTTTLAATFATGTFLTVIGATNPVYNGFYLVKVGGAGVTAFTLVPQFKIAAGTGGSGGGTAATCQVSQNVRAEDISWQNANAAGQLLDIRDRNGNPVWQATATAAGSQNRGKVYWIEGITLIQLQSGVVLVTVN